MACEAVGDEEDGAEARGPGAVAKLERECGQIDDGSRSGGRGGGAVPAPMTRRALGSTGSVISSLSGASERGLGRYERVPSPMVDESLSSGRSGDPSAT